MSKSLWALSTLVVQNATLVLLMRFSYRSGARPYSSTLVIFFAEVLKLVACVTKLKNDGNDARGIYRLCMKSYFEPLVVLPSILYFVQNSCQFIAARALPAVLYVVLLQLKVVTSAIFSKLILRTQLSRVQAFALLTLTLGAAAVQVPKTTEEQVDKMVLKGTLVMCAITSCSGLAGVILEKLFKSKDDISEYITSSVWSRNVQLTCCSLPLVMLNIALQDWERFTTGHIFEGFDTVVLAIIIFQSLGGLLTGYVMKYASAILKCFAGVISMCICAIYSVSVGERELSGMFLFGIGMVSFSVFGFTYGRKK